MFSEYLTFVACLLVGLWLWRWLRRQSALTAVDAGYTLLRRQFFPVYVIMMAADWMQGPYVYALYANYGFSRADNALLFIAGFGSSLVFGTWAGPLADLYGRKRSCVLYGIAYFLSCATKFFNHFPTLMLGRLLGGFATSILWSSFESWMVSEHLSRGLRPELISDTFSTMIELNGVVAIVSGLVAQAAASYWAHPVAPFGVSAALLVVGSVIIMITWKENFGNRGQNVASQMLEAANVVREDRKVFLVGLQQALFEGAMYTFVFLWTPAFGENQDLIPHGIIFATFMMACSIGSIVFGVVADHMIRIVAFTTVIYIASAISMSVPIILPGNSTAIMGSFTAFEVFVGMFWPSIGTLRSRYVPEAHRASIINLFRIPLNGLVCAMLSMQHSLTVSDVFMFCVVMHLAAAAVSVWLRRHGDAIEVAVRSDSPTK